MRFTSPFFDLSVGFSSLSHLGFWSGSSCSSNVAVRLSSLETHIVAWNAAIDTYLKGDLAQTDVALKMSTQLSLSINMTASSLHHVKGWNEHDSKAAIDVYTSLGGNVTFVTGEIQENMDALTQATNLSAFIQGMLPPIDYACDGFADTLKSKTGASYAETIQNVTASIDTAVQSLTSPQSSDATADVSANADSKSSSEANVSGGDASGDGSTKADGSDTKVDVAADGQGAADATTASGADGAKQQADVTANADGSGDSKAKVSADDSGVKAAAKADGDGSAKAAVTQTGDQVTPEQATPDTKITANADGSGDSQAEVTGGAGGAGGSSNTETKSLAGGKVKVEATPDGKKVNVTSKADGGSSLKVESNGADAITASANGGGKASASLSKDGAKQRRSETTGFVYRRRSLLDDQ